MMEELIRRNRSCRRFYQDQAVSREALLSLVNLARLSASAANLQPLKYALSWEPEKNAAIFACLAWAGYLKDWPGPVEGERPAAYIVILGDKDITPNFGCDHGIAAQSILLGAREQDLGGCILGLHQPGAVAPGPGPPRALRHPSGHCSRPPQGGSGAHRGGPGRQHQILAG